MATTRHAPIDSATDTHAAGTYVSWRVPHCGVTTELVTLDCGGGRVHLKSFDRHVEAWDRVPAGCRPATAEEIEIFQAYAANFGWTGRHGS